MKLLIKSLVAYLAFTVLLGIIYPITITGIANFFVPYKAQGSLIKINEKIVGSELIAQSFSNPKYFHSRPSATDYNAASSGGSGLAPSSKKLINLVSERIKKIRKDDNLKNGETVPADMVLTSASGLDPHITFDNAMLQTKRVAKARNMKEEAVKSLIKQNVKHSFIGIWGIDCVNVLKLNMMLDKNHD